MYVYAVTIITILILSTLILTYFSKKKSFLNFKSIISIALCVFVISMLIPVLLASMLQTYENGSKVQFSFNALVVILLIILIYLLLVFLFTIFTTLLSKDSDRDTKEVVETGINEEFQGVIKLTLNYSKHLLGKFKSLMENDSQQNLAGSESSTDIISEEGLEVVSEYQKNHKIESEEVKEDNNSEKFVDSSGNIDKMGIEEYQALKTFEEIAVSDEYAEESEGMLQNKEQFYEKEYEEENKEEFINIETGKLENEMVTEALVERNDYEKQVDIKQIADNPGNVNDYIDEAFKFKCSGDLEGAILYYMYALDLNPPKDLVFWIVLDSCALYKELGQTELARSILEGYYTNFKDVMDESVKAEIEKNLVGI